MSPTPELYIGLNSGTSMDGVDAALVDFGPDRPDLLHALCEPWPEDLKSALREAAQGGAPLSAERLAALDAAAGEHLAGAAGRLLQDAGVDAGSVAAIGSHGQTVAHEPGHEPHGFTLQIGDPNRIAERTGITTVADFRRRDIAAGGQGAPLMAGFHASVLGSPDRDIAVLNVGGIANLTLLPGAPDRPASGLDTGPGNCLLDAWARRHLARDFDQRGVWAATGRTDDVLLERFLDEPYFRAQPPKTTGTQHFSEQWLDERLARASAAPADVAATLVALTAVTVARSLATAGFGAERLLVCGGGAHNETLLESLRGALPGVTVETTAAAGIDPDWVEAMGFAWLARETQAGRPGNVPTVTGAAGPRVLGAIHPGK